MQIRPSIIILLVSFVAFSGLGLTYAILEKTNEAILWLGAAGIFGILCAINMIDISERRILAAIAKIKS